MPSNFELFKKQLDEAVELIDESVLMDETNYPAIVDEALDTQSLLARCDTISQKHESNKPVIRVIHHLACSGGTLISKCISALPNVFLLSEVHPYTDLGIDKGKAKYSPTDIVSLTRHAGIPEQKILAKKIFNNAIDIVFEHVKNQGGILVIRDHTHADYSTNAIIPEVGSIVELLQDRYDVKSILTIRDPIDSYTSLKKNGWIHFSPESFDEYCRRLILLIENSRFSNVYKYENFLVEPQENMKKIAESLSLPFDDSFEDIFSLFNVTGDSGRTADVIGERDRIAPESIIKESETSEWYKRYLGFNFN